MVGVFLEPESAQDADNSRAYGAYYQVVHRVYKAGSLSAIRGARVPVLYAINIDFREFIGLAHRRAGQETILPTLHIVTDDRVYQVFKNFPQNKESKRETERKKSGEEGRKLHVTIFAPAESVYNGKPARGNDKTARQMQKLVEVGDVVIKLVYLPQNKMRQYHKRDGHVDEPRDLKIVLFAHDYRNTQKQKPPNAEEEVLNHLFNLIFARL